MASIPRSARNRRLATDRQSGAGGGALHRRRTRSRDMVASGFGTVTIAAGGARSPGVMRQGRFKAGNEKR